MIRREFPEVIVLSDLAASSEMREMSYNELQLRVMFGFASAVLTVLTLTYSKILPMGQIVPI